MRQLRLRLLLLLCLCCAVGTSWGKIAHLLPRPHAVVRAKGHFSLARPILLDDPTHCAQLAAVLSEMRCTFSGKAQAAVRVRLDSTLDTFDYPLEGFPSEGYRLRISPQSIDITAATPVGVIRAAQTLRQLAQGSATPRLECLTITDFPAFKVRGFMHDVGRSFIPIDDLRRQIDLLSRFKVNVFHWHLTENQAWRLEIKAFPQLTSAASMTRFAGRYYTQAEARALEAYARERGVTIIPEIDMPGHSEAFVRAMGFDMQSAQGVAALHTILEEVAAIFPHAPYLHIGADEKRITYPDFLPQMIAKVHALGRKVVVWNPIQGVDLSTLDIDMTQMWSAAGRKIAGKPNIDCRYNYTNHFDVFADLVGIYKSNIYYAPRGNAELAGTISCLWNDRQLSDASAILQQNNFYANVLASAERGWIGGGEAYIEQSGVTLPNAGAEFEAFRDWERRFLFHKSTTLAAEPVPYVRQTNVVWRITDPFPNGGNPQLALPPETEGLKTTYTLGGRTYATHRVTGAGLYLRHTWGKIVPALFAEAQPHSTAYAWTYVYSPRPQAAGALIEGYNYSRSERDLAPPSGSWDRMGTTIWLNDSLIAPPRFDNSGKTLVSHEDLLLNENFTGRAPQKVWLRAGWNKVLLKLPFQPDGGTRLKKWMFTFVLTDLTGRQALDGLIYSPDRVLPSAPSRTSRR